MELREVVGDIGKSDHTDPINFLMTGPASPVRIQHISRHDRHGKPLVDESTSLVIGYFYDTTIAIGRDKKRGHDKNFLHRLESQKR